MRHMGVLDPTVDPMVEGGISEEQQRDLESQGWRKEVTKYRVSNAGVVFRDESRPAGVVLKLVDIPEGIDYMYNPEDGTAIILSCGNATCWRYLL